jgi:60 kDa SS-A/Ro ribonucleoprotein
MANKNLFESFVGKLLPATDSVNEELAPAYAFSPKHMLAQYAATGCLNSTYYADEKAQLARVLALCGEVEPAFIAKAALYCRERGFMKDTPALLCAVLATRDLSLLQGIFHRVIDNGRMLRNFVQIIRSGAAGRKSLGTRPKRLVQSWIDRQTEDGLFRAAVGQDPSLEDIVKMVHPKPKTAAQEALYGYLLGRPYDTASLPPLARQYEDFKNGRLETVPDVPMLKLTALELGPEAWAQIAERAPWQTLRMNLNTFARHEVFSRPELTVKLAARLRDAEAIRRARVFPYQLLVAFMNANEIVPAEIKAALQDAMEIAIDNIPVVPGRVIVCPDVSGSMSSPVTGYRKGASTTVRCIDVAALIAAAIVRKNPTAEVLPFESDVVHVGLNPHDSVMTNAAKLAAVGGGGTNCSAPLKLMNERDAHGDLVVFVSDNQSWVDAGAGRGTATMQEWQRFKARNPSAKLVCIDIQPYGTTQAQESADVLNVGGFSDAVFTVFAAFQTGALGADHWVSEIEAVSLA